MKSKRLIFVFVSLILLLVFGVGQAADPPAGGGSGAIFTTTPDGGIVNENVRYEAKNYVYLDGGPPPNAPSKAAGLDAGYYVFQITDPPGKLLLSVDPARCRVVHVNEDGVIDRLVPPQEVPGLGAASNNWSDSITNGKFDYSTQACHTAEAPDPPAPAGPDDAGTDVVNVPGFYGLGRHDTNTDVDHGDDVGAIVVQMMPYGTTPNPGGVYKAWLTPLDAYVGVKKAELDTIPQDIKGRVRPHECPDFCAAADPGFVPSNRYTKTDNFKVKEFFPAEIRVRKFEDLNGNGIWDAGEPEIGVDKCVDEANGDFVDCPGGWPYDFTEPLNGTTMTQKFYTPFTHIAGVAGIYSAEEFYLAGWQQTASWLDDSYQDPFQKKVDVQVAAIAPGEYHEIRFGNFKLVDVTACKVDDADGSLATTDDQTPVPGWTVYYSIDGVRQQPGQLTGDDGCYTWTGLGPGHSYDVEEDDPAPEWTALTPLSHDFGPAVSGQSYSFTFANFKNVDVEACKLEDADGDINTTDDQTPVAGWLVYLSIDGTRQTPGKLTGDDGCASWTNLGPGHSYDVEEDDHSPEWTALTPLTHDFGPAISGESYSFTFVNFRNVDVTACKLKDADGNLGTTDDQTPKPGWPVYLTKNGVRQDTQLTGEDGCYTWENLPPVVGGYYDVGEDPQDGWIALTPTYYAFESPPQSGASYSFTFVNTPTQGCTPGFWQGGSAGGQAGGRWLWDTNGLFTDVISDPDWVASGGDGANPYNHLDGFCAFFGCVGNAEDMWHFVNPDMWEVNDDFHKAARSLTAAYLNASWGMAYSYSTDELKTMWADAMASSTLLALHNDLDAANNAPIGGCPISASGN